MHELAAKFFWTCSFIILYTYAGYPLLAFLLVSLKKLFRKKRVSTQPGIPPPISLIVAAYNEEADIARKIQNCLNLQYPPQLLDIIIITDGSTDRTPEIVAAHPQVRHLHQPARGGKLAAANRAAMHSSSPILVFSDANTMLNPEALLHIANHYIYPGVGGVAGEKRIAGAGRDLVGAGEGLYWKYESLLKRIDSDLKTTVGAAGELFSIRRSLYTMLPENTVIEDFVQSMKVCEKGFVVRYEPRAYAIEAASLDLRDEMERKTRISAGAFQAIWMLRHLLNPFVFPVVSFQLFSHRVLRWTLCPLALPVLLLASILASMTAGHPIYQLALIAQLLAYTLAIAGWLLARGNARSRILFPFFYFLFMNFCVYTGFFRYVRRTQSVLWASAKRKS